MSEQPAQAPDDAASRDQNASVTTGFDIGAAFPNELVTRSLVRDVQLPGGGTLALVTLDNGQDHTKPNTLGPATLTGLGRVLDQLHQRARDGQIVAVAVTGKPFVFAAGADLLGVGALTERDQALAIARLGHATFAKLSDLPVPSFAFTNGAALGGGVEIGLYCSYRTISSGVPMYALPECFLGMVPGWGGAFLLPNLVGIDGALQVIVANPLEQNRMLTGPQAYELGAADAMFAPVRFLEDSIRWAGQVLDGTVSITRPEVDRDQTRWDGAIAAARAAVDARTGRTAPAPYRALELLAAARTAERSAAFAAEDQALADLLMGDELRAGLYAFDLVQRRARRPAGAPDRSLARPVSKVGVVGAGLMASQLALLFARRLKVPVVMSDLDQGRVDKGLGYLADEVGRLRDKKRIRPDEASRVLASVTGTTDLAQFADADLVVEAVFEELSVKARVFADLERVVSPETVLATNTSSLSVGAMAADLAHPERVVGLHFFNPVAVMPLLEVVRAQRTDDATVATALATAKTLRKSAVLVGDSPSFIVNRLLGRLMGEVSRIVDQGTPIAVVDTAFAGLAPMPPFVLLGMVGPAIALHNNESLHAAFPDRFYVSPSLRRVVEAGKRGFYDWPQGRPELDPEVEAMLEHPADPVVLRREQVRDRVLAALAQEARLMVDDQVVAAPQDLDLAMITGAGFSFWNGGLTPLLDRTGVAQRETGRRFLSPGVADVPRPETAR